MEVEPLGNWDLNNVVNKSNELAGSNLQYQLSRISFAKKDITAAAPPWSFFDVVVLLAPSCACVGDGICGTCLACCRAGGARASTPVGMAPELFSRFLARARAPVVFSSAGS